MAAEASWCLRPRCCSEAGRWFGASRRTLLELGDQFEESCRLSGLTCDGESSALALDDVAGGDEGAVSAAVHEGDSAEVDRHRRVRAGCRCGHELVAGCEVEFARHVDEASSVCGGSVDRQFRLRCTGPDVGWEFDSTSGGHRTLLALESAARVRSDAASGGGSTRRRSPYTCPGRSAAAA